MRGLPVVLLGGLAAVVAGIFQGCGAGRPSLSTLAETDPQVLVARQDSLLAVRRDDPELLPALTSAHLNLAEAAQAGGDWDTALEEYAAALQLEPRNRQARYGQAMVEGHRLYRKGSRSALWDAIEKYGSATVYAPERGEPPGLTNARTTRTST
jgi:tetratricopeptide (TPR) repeat protein